VLSFISLPFMPPLRRFLVKPLLSWNSAHKKDNLGNIIQHELLNKKVVVSWSYPQHHKTI